MDKMDGGGGGGGETHPGMDTFKTQFTLKNYTVTKGITDTHFFFGFLPFHAMVVIAKHCNRESGKSFASIPKS